MINLLLLIVFIALDTSLVLSQPPEWTCDPDFYSANDGCDCECGAFDPDCYDVDSILYGCGDGQLCDLNATCFSLTYSVYIPNGCSENGTYLGNSTHAFVDVVNCTHSETPVCGSSFCYLDPIRDLFPENEYNLVTTYSDSSHCVGSSRQLVFWKSAESDCSSVPYYCDGTRIVECSNGRSHIHHTCFSSEPSLVGYCVGGNPPNEWTCHPSGYNSGISCNCGCGTYDPDCDNDSLDIVGCRPSYNCSEEGECTPTRANLYTHTDGCDSSGNNFFYNATYVHVEYIDITFCNESEIPTCNRPYCTRDPLRISDLDYLSISHFNSTCGLDIISVDYWRYDLANCMNTEYTCNTTTRIVTDCNSSMTINSVDCLDTGEDIISVNCPPEWNCDRDYYNRDDGCDCNCGSYDPDCDISQEILYGCGFRQICGSTGICENITNIVETTAITDISTDTQETSTTAIPTRDINNSETATEHDTDTSAWDIDNTKTENTARETNNSEADSEYDTADPNISLFAVVSVLSMMTIML